MNNHHAYKHFNEFEVNVVPDLETQAGCIVICLPSYCQIKKLNKVKIDRIIRRLRLE